MCATTCTEFGSKNLKPKIAPASCMCALVLSVLNPESLLLLFSHLPHSTHSQPAAAGQLTFESRWSSCPSTTYPYVAGSSSYAGGVPHLPPTIYHLPSTNPLSFQQHSRFKRESPLFSYTFPLHPSFFHSAPLFSTTFPHRPAKKNSFVQGDKPARQGTGWVSSPAWRMAESFFERASMLFGLRQRPARRAARCLPLVLT